MTDNDRFWQVAPGRKQKLAHRWAPTGLFLGLGRRWCNKGGTERLRKLAPASDQPRCKACVRIEQSTRKATG